MTARTAIRRTKPSTAGIHVRYRERDSMMGVSRHTTARLAEVLGIPVTQVVHVALAQLAQRTLPRYEPDDGPLTDADYLAISRRVPQQGFKAKGKRLF